MPTPEKDTTICAANPNTGGCGKPAVGPAKMSAYGSHYCAECLAEERPEPRYVPALTADLPAVDSYRLAFGAEGEE